MDPHMDGEELQVDGEHGGLGKVECEEIGNDAHPHHLRRRLSASGTKQ